MLSFNTSLIRAADQFKSNEQTRYYLRGVFFTAHAVQGAIGVATDGHTLLAVYDEKGYCERDMILSFDKPTLQQFKPQRGDYTENRRVFIGADRMAKIVPCEDDTTGATYGVAQVQEIDGTFPNWRAVLPKTDSSELDLPKTAATFDASYIAKFSKMIAELDCKNAGMAVKQFSPNAPALVKFARADVFGVIMPRRDDVDGENLPAWMKG